MHISILLMEQIIELFIMILMGFIIVKAGIVKDEDSKVLSKIVLYLIIPCVIINAFQVDYNSKTVRGLLIAFAASVILQLVLLFIISAMGRLFHMNEVEVISLLFKFRQSDCSDCDIYTGAGVGALRLCFHECAAGIFVDSLQKDYKP